MFMQGFLLFSLVFEGYSLRCYYGQNFLERTGNDKSGIPVSSRTCSSGQGCGTASYQYSFVDKSFQRNSASVAQGVCVDHVICANPSEYCRKFRNSLVSRGFTIHYCQLECCYSDYCNTKASGSLLTSNLKTSLVAVMLILWIYMGSM